MLKVKVKVKIKVMSISISPIGPTRNISKRRSGSRDNTVLPAHDAFHPLRNEPFSGFAFPPAAGTHLPIPEGWKAE